MIPDRHEQLVFPIHSHAAQGPTSLLFQHSSIHAASTAVEDQAADGTNDEAKADDADERIRDEQGTTKRGGGVEVTEANGEEGHGGPVDCIEVAPSLDIAEQKGAEKQIDEEHDGLQHQRPLARREHEILGVAAEVGTHVSHYHERGHQKVEGRRVDGVVKRLGPDKLILGLNHQRPRSSGSECYQAERRDVPANEGDGLSKGEAEAPSHIQEQGHVGEDGNGQLDSVDGGQPWGVADERGRINIGARRVALSPWFDEGADTEC